MRDTLWVRIVAWIVLAVLCVPIAVAYAFAVYDVGSGGGVGRATKTLRMAALVLPVVVALACVAWRDLRVRRARLSTAPVAWVRIIAATLGMLLVLVVALFTVSIDRGQPAAPGPFYDAPSPLPAGAAGAVLRSESLPGAPAGAKAWRLLYLSTRLDGTPTAVSAILIVPNAPAPAGGRPVVAWQHGAVGVGRNCAPSLRANWAGFIDGLALFVQQGYVVVSTDYEGLGASGSHGLLVGETAAKNVLDSVRAAHNFAEAGAGTRFAVWGESQGGHASLFTGEFAASYAPEMMLVGVAAVVPPTDLSALFDRNLGTTFGNVLASFAFATWARTYPDATLNQIITPLAQPIVRNLAAYCFLEERETLSILPGSLLTRVTFLSRPPKETEPWKRLLAENSPGQRRIPAPLLIAQGAVDPLVRPDITHAYAARICAAGDTVEYRSYPGVGHVGSGKATAPDVVAWMNDRFAGKPPARTCTGV